MQAVIHGRHRQPQERGNILLRAVVDVKKHYDLAQRARQICDGGEHSSNLLVTFEAVVGVHNIRRDGIDGPERHDFELAYNLAYSPALDLNLRWLYLSSVVGGVLMVIYSAAGVVDAWRAR